MAEALHDHDARINLLLEEARAELRRGGRLDPDEWRRRYPDLADELSGLLETLCRFDTAIQDWRRTADTAVTGAGLATPPPECGTPPSAPQHIGRYVVSGRVGGGGMGTVFRAEDPELRRAVAVKVPHFKGPNPERARLRFLREARAAAAIRHPNVCPIYDVGEQGDTPFVVMAYVPGSSLADRLEREGSLADEREAVDLVRQVAAGLAAVHAHSIVHRDLKPANVLIDEAGQALLADFGLALPPEDGVRLTTEDAIVGTPAYMAPEQVDSTLGPVSPRSDVYGLGAVLYHMLTGQPPRRGGVLEVLGQLVSGTEPPDVASLRPGLDPALAALVRKALARRPADRFAGAEEMERALAQWLDRAGERRVAAGRRRRAVIAAAVLLAFVGAAAAGIVLIIKNKKGDEVARVTVPEGGSVTPIPDGKEGGEPANGDLPELKPDQPRAYQPGEPLWNGALATRPASLKGVSSWTVETVGHRAPVSAAAYSPDGRWLATGDWSGQVRVWDAETNQLRQVLAVDAFPAERLALAWRKDGHYLAASYGDKVVVWEMPDGRRIREMTLPASPGWDQALAWLPDGKKLALGTGGTACVLDAESGETLSTWTVKSARAVPSPDGTRLLWLPDTEGGVLEVWDTRTGKSVAELPMPKAARKQEFAQRCYPSWSPDGTHVAVLWSVPPWKDGGLFVVDVAARKIVLEVSAPNPVFGTAGIPPGTALPVRWSPDGKNLILFCENRVGNAGIKVRWLEASTGKLVRRSEEDWDGSGQPPLSAAVSPDGKRLAVSGFSGRIFLYEGDHGQRRALIRGNGFEYVPAFPCLSFLDRRTLWVGQTDFSSGCSASCWDLAAGAPLSDDPPRSPGSVYGKIKGPAGACQADLAAESDVLAVRWANHAAEVYRASDGKLLRAITIESLGGVSVTPNGRLVALAGHGRAGDTPYEVAVCKTETGEVVASWVLGGTGFYAPAISPDGKTVAFGNSTDKRIRFRAVEGKAREDSFDALLPGVQALRWSPDGKVLAALNQDTVRLLRADDGRPLGTLLYHAGDALNGYFPAGWAVSPEGHYRATRTTIGMVYVVATPDGRQRTLTQEEMDKEFGWKNDPSKVRLLPE
jgi:WD40 repeat protein